jgi:hypothetical protein
MKKDADALKKELEELAPTLAQMKKNPQPAQVPEGYFDALAGAVLERARTRPGSRFFYARLLAAASFLLLAGALLFLFRPNPPKAPEAAFAAFSMEEMEAYVSDRMDYIDLDLMMLHASEGAAPGPNEESGYEHYLPGILDDLDWRTLNDIL